MENRTIDHSWDFKNVDTKEYTHCYHSYPAMMIPQIARRIIDEYKPDGKLDLLFDPYMGSGTSLVESSLAGINSIGTDINPLARLIASVKTSIYDVNRINYMFDALLTGMYYYPGDDNYEDDFEHISNHDYWYRSGDLKKLSYLHKAIIQYGYCVNFFEVIVSELARDISFTRNGEFKRYRVKEEKINNFDPNVFLMFIEKFKRNVKGLSDYVLKRDRKTMVHVHDFNSVKGIPSSIIKDGSVDMVLTSPPYGDSKTTVAYGQYSSWSNEWFKKGSSSLDSDLMGGKKQDVELFNTETIRDELDKINVIDHDRYRDVISFLNDYYKSIINVSKSIRRGGIASYVVGNRTVKGIQIPLDYFTVEVFESAGFSHVKTIVREFPSKRMPLKVSPTNKSGSNVSTMNNEYIVIMEKR